MLIPVFTTKKQRFKYNDLISDEPKTTHFKI